MTYALRFLLHAYFSLCLFFVDAAVMVSVSFGLVATLLIEFIVLGIQEDLREQRAEFGLPCEYGQHVYREGYSQPCSNCGYEGWENPPRSDLGIQDVPADAGRGA